MTARNGHPTGAVVATIALVAAIGSMSFAVVMLAGATAIVAGPALALITSATTGAGCGAAGTGEQVAGIWLDADQLQIAQTILTVTATKRLPAWAGVVAVAAAYQESRLANLPGGDADSVGVFQQRLTYYSPAVARDPARATAAFLDRLVAVPGWAVLPVTVAAQAVQRSAYPDAYAQWQPLAEQVVGLLWPATAATLALTPTAGSSPSSSGTVAAPRMGGGAGTEVCPDPSTGTGAARAAGGGGCVAPLPGAMVTSAYGWRTSPVTGAPELHPGVDLAGGPTVGAGAPIRAACAGIVATAGPASGYGNYLQIQHPGFVTGYGHMWVLAVHPGDHVSAGQVIAYVGCAGACTGPHLHLDVRPTVWGPTSDPVAFFAARGVVIG